MNLININNINIDNYDLLIVGAGFVGAVIAQLSAKEGKKVLVIEKRQQAGGNMHDEINPYGIRIQKYGPHIIHTDNEDVITYLNQFTEFSQQKLEYNVYMNEKFTPSPFNLTTIDDFFSKNKAKDIKHILLSTYPNRKFVTIVELLKSKNTLIKEYADFLYNNDYSLYTAKQWGIDPKEINISVLKRVPVSLTYETGYFNNKYQVFPSKGYDFLFHNILDSANIDMCFNTNALNHLKIQNNAMYFNGILLKNKLIYTGSLDKLFNNKYGKLPYRSLSFKYITLQKKEFQSVPVVAYPQEKTYTRITEYTKFPNQISNFTTIAYEYPIDYSEKNEPYYPIFTKNNELLYYKYLNLAKNIPNLIVAGRLADYKYYNMDDAILRAFEIFKKNLKESF